MKRLALVVLFLICSNLCAAEPIPQVFMLDGNTLVANRRRIRAEDPALKAALDRLVRDAERRLSAGPFSVTDKDQAPPSGDEHDYQSLGPYWWPDPDKPDGKPYIRKDGRVNPERSRFGDSARFQEMQETVNRLAVAWFFTEREAFAKKATDLIRAWYLDPKTRMNPHLDYAQAIPGRTEGRGIGIVDSQHQPLLIDSVGLLQGSKAWTEKDQQGMIEWFEQFLRWMQTSEKGKDEDRTKNNHATQYDVQVASYALFVGKPEMAKEVLQAVGKRRIETQIEPDGSQPHELKRTRSWDYSCANTINFTRLAELGRQVDVDLWAYESDGRSIRKAIDFLLPFATGKEAWTRKQIRGFQPEQLLIPLLQAVPHDVSGEYAQAAADLLAKDALERLLFGVQSKPEGK